MLLRHVRPPAAAALTRSTHSVLTRSVLTRSVLTRSVLTRSVLTRSVLTRSVLACAVLACAPLSGCGSSERVIINELVAANGNGLRDGDGDTSDWIELFNATQQPVNLSGWCLTDDPRDLRRWCFPEVSLPAQGYLVVFASGKRQRPGAEHELHASFKLKSSADYVGLVRPLGSIASELAYPDQKQDVSFGLSREGVQGFLDVPTPGAANGELRLSKR